MSNSENKSAARLARAHKKELAQPHTGILHKLYDGSPGYSKVFIDSNRLDIGDLVRANRLPQRANAAADTATPQARTRNETVAHKNCTTTEFSLEPPRILTQWSSTVPKTRLYNDNGGSLIKSIDESRKRILRRKKY